MAQIDTQTLAAIVETIVIEAPVSAVFAALSDPDELVQWWGSEDGYRTTKMETDMRVGGAWKTIGTRSDGSPFSVGGVYRVIDPPHHLEFTWRHDWADGDDASDDTIVRYDLEARDGATHLRLTHSGFTSQEDRDDHQEGWPIVLGWMRTFVER